MALGSWFNAEYFASQKLAQMAALGETIPDGATPLAQLETAIANYNRDNNANVTVESNFEACNQGGYVSSIPSTAINVSPNELFDVSYYLTAAAQYANDNGYTASGFSLPWTAQTVLEHMYGNGYSAWEHFKTAGLDERLDCSAKFSTSKYIAAKAEALGISEDAVVAQMKADGLNPVMDYFENGIELDIKEADLAPQSALNVTVPAGFQWGAIEQPGSDPFDDVQAYVDVESGNTGPYAGENGVNTQFDAKYVLAAGQTTLSAADQITADPNAMNTLAIELNKSWDGFKGIAPEGKDFVLPEDYLPNVTGVGRIKLDRAALSSEHPITFDAKNISDDAVQFDLNAAGTGTTSLKNLSDAVERVNITGLLKASGDALTTDLRFVSDANGGRDDTLIIGVDDVYAKGGTHQITGSGLENFENLVVDAMGGKSGLDVSAFDNAKVVTVTGAGDLTLKVDFQDKVKTLDASQSTGNVNFNVVADTTNSQTITGGSGQDTVTISAATTASFKAASWSSIETVAFNNAGDVTINAKGAEAGVGTFWVNNTAENKVTNLTASDVTVYQSVPAANTSKATTITGGKNGAGLGNVTWVSAGTNDDNPDGTAIKANLVFEGQGTATVEVTQEDALEDGSSFTFANASAVKINAPNASATGVGVPAKVTLLAGNAKSLEVNLDGSLAIADDSGYNAAGPTPTYSGALGSVQTLTVSLTNESDDVDAFDMSTYQLKALQQATINADGMDVNLGVLGTTEKGAGFTLSISDADVVVIKGMEAGLGNNIQAQIEAAGAVSLGVVETATNQNVNNQGDVTLNITSDDEAKGLDATSITGGQLNLDFTGVAGWVAGDSGGTMALELSAQERIIYQGADGTDNIKITSVGKGSTSSISLGDGVDNIAIAIDGDDPDTVATEEINVKGAVINVEMGGGKDTLVISKAENASGVIRVNVMDFDGDNRVEVKNHESADDIAAVLKDAGLSASLADADWNASGVYYDLESDTAYFAAKDVVVVVADAGSADCFATA